MSKLLQKLLELENLDDETRADLESLYNEDIAGLKSKTQELIGKLKSKTSEPKSDNTDYEEIISKKDEELSLSKAELARLQREANKLAKINDEISSKHKQLSIDNAMANFERAFSFSERDPASEAFMRSIIGFENGEVKYGGLGSLEEFRQSLSENKGMESALKRFQSVESTSKDVTLARPKTGDVETKGHGIASLSPKEAVAKVNEMWGLNAG